MRGIITLTCFALSFLACSSGGQGDPGLQVNGTGGGDASRVCPSLCGWQERCGKDNACSAECPAEIAKYQGKWSAAFIDHITRCFSALSCSQSDDVCVSDFKSVDPAFPDIPEVQACLARRTECKNAFTDDYCLSIAALTTSARAEAEACRARPCAEVRTCLGAAGAYNY